MEELVGSPGAGEETGRRADPSATLRDDNQSAGDAQGRSPAERKKSAKNWPSWLIATVFGVGYLKPGPGTYGSAVACVLWLIAGWFVHHDTHTLTLVTAVGVVLATAAGIPAATRVARESGRSDPGFVVIDEVAGQWVALLLLPPLWPNALLAFILFRFFDILKPPPIRQLEALPEGTGIMVDDLGAGVFALALGQLLLYLLAKIH